MHVQEYYKNGYISSPDSQSIQELRETCDYFMIPFSEKTVKTNNLSEYYVHASLPSHISLNNHILILAKICRQVPTQQGLMVSQCYCHFTHVQ